MMRAQPPLQCKQSAVLLTQQACGKLKTMQLVFRHYVYMPDVKKGCTSPVSTLVADSTLYIKVQEWHWLNIKGNLWFENHIKQVGF